MSTDNQRLAEDYRDSNLWKLDHPSNGTDKACCKCGKAIDDDPVDFHVEDSSGTHWYNYHEECVANTLANASEEELKQGFTDKPVLIPFLTLLNHSDA